MDLTHSAPCPIYMQDYPFHSYSIPICAWYPLTYKIHEFILMAFVLKVIRIRSENKYNDSMWYKSEFCRKYTGINRIVKSNSPNIKPKIVSATGWHILYRQCPSNPIFQYLPLIMYHWQITGVWDNLTKSQEPPLVLSISAWRYGPTGDDALYSLVRQGYQVC